MRQIDPPGDVQAEIAAYVQRKPEMARECSSENRLVADEVLQGAPRIGDVLAGWKALVDEKATAIHVWAEEGTIAPVDPHHLPCSI